MSVEFDRKEYFKDVVFTVEATHFEQYSLWMIYHNHDVGFGKVGWVEGDRGHGVSIGRISRRPVVVSLNYAWIDGHRVCFYYGCSQLVDHEMVDEWMEARTDHIVTPDRRPATCDAMNFGHCLQAIKALNARKVGS